MNNYVGELLKAYYRCLSGNLSYETEQVKTYNVSVDAHDKFHHVIVRPEGENDVSNKSSFVTNPVVTVEVYTVHDGAIDASVVEDIDNQLRQLIFPTRNTIGITHTANMQVLNIKAENSVYLEGFNGSKHEHRKITRFTNRVNQL